MLLTVAFGISVSGNVQSPLDFCLVRKKPPFWVQKGLTSLLPWVLVGKTKIIAYPSHWLPDCFSCKDSHTFFFLYFFLYDFLRKKQIRESQHCNIIVQEIHRNFFFARIFKGFHRRIQNDELFSSLPLESLSLVNSIIHVLEGLCQRKCSETKNKWTETDFWLT